MNPGIKVYKLNECVLGRAILASWYKMIQYRCKFTFLQRGIKMANCGISLLKM